MPSRRSRGESGPTSLHQAALPVACIVTADEDFLEVVIPELSPWVEVVLLDLVGGLAGKEAGREECGENFEVPLDRISRGAFTDCT